ncbi:MAG: sulfite exporter TauE/SafE family protein [Bacteroidetes bacterium]|nr:sulfite exporter TauE/SafE family protein [Bacteroidota bacterium]
MFKKIFIYGISFGSIAGAFLFVHLNNYGPDMSNFQKIFFLLIYSLILPATCVYLLSKNIRKDSLEKDPKNSKPGTVIIAGLFAGMVIALTIAGIYAFIAAQFPDIIEKAIQTDLAKLNDNMDKYMEFYKKTKDEIIQLTKDRYSVGNQLRDNMYQFTSIGLLVSGIMALVYMNRDKKRSAANTNAQND